MTKIPAEWTPQRAVWTAWPSHVEDWGDDYLLAREEIIPMIQTLAKGQRVKLLATGDEAVRDARLYFEHDHVDVVHAAFSTIWIHDTGPLFGMDKHGPLALCIKAGGMDPAHPYDNDVSGFIGRATGLRFKQPTFRMQGGAVDFDGAGRALLSRNGLLAQDANADIGPEELDDYLQDSFGLNHTIWLDGAIEGDPTEGHVNMLARFVAPNTVVCQTPSGINDPNAALLTQTEATLRAQGLDVVLLPSPGRVTSGTSAIAPASHMGFVIGNQSVIMPSYEKTYSREACAILQELFPDRQVVALPANHLLSGGQGFHGMTRAEPAFESGK